MTQIFKLKGKIKLFLSFLLVVVLTLGFSLSLQSVSAALIGTSGTSVKFDSGANLGNGQNVIWGLMGAGSSGTGSFILLQKPAGTDKFRVDHNGNVTAAGNIVAVGNMTVAGQNVCRQNGVNCPAVTASQWTTASPNIYYNTGNVGIGITNPGAKLEIQSTSNRAMIVNGSIYEGGGVPLVLFSNNAGSGGGTTLEITNLANNTGAMAKFTNLGLGPTAVFTGGNVGIGTTNPSRKLEVRGAILVSELTQNQTVGYFSGAGVSAPTVGIENANGAGGIALRVSNAGGAGNAAEFISEGGVAGYFNSNGGMTALIVDQGNVGIGTTNPGAKLEVAGQVKITGGSPGAGKVLTSDVAGLASWQTPAAGAEADTLQTVTTRGNSTSLGLVVNGQTLNHQANNLFYLNSYDGLQLRINADGIGSSDFRINNSANSTVLAVSDTGNMSMPGMISVASGIETGYWRIYQDSSNNLNITNGSVTGDLLIFPNAGGYGVSIGNLPPKNILDVWGNMAIGAYAGVYVAPNDGLIVSGNVGIGTEAPKSKLHINGDIQLNNANHSACNNDHRGAIKYENDHFYGCRTTGWAQLDN